MSVLQVVTIASRNGLYGGPFDTAKRQVVLAQECGLKVRLWAGALQHDAPEPGSLPKGTALIPVRNWLPKLGFTSAVSLKALTSLSREIRNSDCVHVSFSRELLPVVAALVALLYRKRLILQPHGMLTSRTSGLHRVVDVLVKPIVRASHTLVALTEVERDDLASWLGNDGGLRWLIMGNPVGRLVGVRPKVREEPAVREALWVARLHPRKRVQDFLAAARISQRHVNGIRFTVVGPDGGHLPLVQDALQNGDPIIYEGAITSDDVTKRVDSTGVFVLTSSAEPWGNVLATALGLGVPVVITRSSALASTVMNFEAGLIVADESPTEIEAAIAKLLDTPAIYEGCSAGALKLAAELLSDEALAEKLTYLYERSSA